MFQATFTKKNKESAVRQHEIRRIHPLTKQLSFNTKH